MKNRFFTILALLITFNAQGQMTLSGSNSAPTAIKGNASTQPTSVEASNLIKKEGIFVYHAMIPKKATKEARDFFLNLQDEAIITAQEGQVNLFASITEPGKAYLLEETQENYLMAGALCAFHSLESMTLSQTIAGGYTVKGKVKIEQLTPIGKSFGVKVGDLASFAIDIQFDLVSNGWIVAKGSPAMSRWSDSEYGRRTVGELIRQQYLNELALGLPTVLQGRWESKGERSYMFAGETCTITNKKGEAETKKFVLIGNEVKDAATRKRIVGLDILEAGKWVSTITFITGPFGLRGYTKKVTESEIRSFSSNILGVWEIPMSGQSVKYTKGLQDSQWNFIQTSKEGETIIEGIVNIDYEGVITSSYMLNGVKSTAQYILLGISSEEIVFQGKNDVTIFFRLKKKTIPVTTKELQNSNPDAAKIPVTTKEMQTLNPDAADERRSLQQAENGNENERLDNLLVGTWTNGTQVISIARNNTFDVAYRVEWLEGGKKYVAPAVSPNSSDALVFTFPGFIKSKTLKPGSGGLQLDNVGQISTLSKRQ